MCKPGELRETTQFAGQSLALRTESLNISTTIKEIKSFTSYLYPLFICTTSSKFSNRLVNPTLTMLSYQ